MSVPKDAACSMPHDHQRSLHDLCRKYMHYHVVLKMKDGSSVHGILEGVNRQEASVLIPEDVTDESSFTAVTDIRADDSGGSGEGSSRLFLLLRCILFHIIKQKPDMMPNP
ncbi:hypothetical protein [Bacillus licheniformis]|uniref:hypothetical protein n=2 Tax=Bacillus licheniformis TaxID=1402 RepID=UPI00228220E8|nr:hypothetical protein [Bacillus licheniformis]MCY9267464.1 hypothetical protein [Bacillus licheniformis]MEC0717908.1 hypothetical protein [Bacillus licheniformis]MEC0793218.1 hypothetical protein [Bacillus licheniformis]